MKCNATIAVVGKIMACETCGIPKTLIRIPHWYCSSVKYLGVYIVEKSKLETPSYTRRLNNVTYSRPKCRGAQAIQANNNAITTTVYYVACIEKKR